MGSPVKVAGLSYGCIIGAVQKARFAVILYLREDYAALQQGEQGI
jgi:hypothetical protein